MKKTILTAIALLFVALISLTSCDLSKTVYYDDGPEYDTEPPIDFDYYYSLLPGYHSIDPETQKSTGIVLPWEDFTYDGEFGGKTELHWLAKTDPELFEELKGTMFVMPYKSRPIIERYKYLNIPSNFIVVSPSVERIEKWGIHGGFGGDGPVTIILSNSVKYFGEISIPQNKSSTTIYYEGTVEEFINIEKVDEHKGYTWKRWTSDDVSVYCLDGTIEYYIVHGQTSKDSYLAYTIVK